MKKKVSTGHNLLPNTRELIKGKVQGKKKKNLTKKKKKGGNTDMMRYTNMTGTSRRKAAQEARKEMLRC